MGSVPASRARLASLEPRDDRSINRSIFSGGCSLTMRSFRRPGVESPPLVAQHVLDSLSVRQTELRGDLLVGVGPCFASRTRFVPSTASVASNSSRRISSRSAADAAGTICSRSRPVPLGRVLDRQRSCRPHFLRSTAAGIPRSRVGAGAHEVSEVRVRPLRAAVAPS